MIQISAHAQNVRPFFILGVVCAHHTMTDSKGNKVIVCDNGTGVSLATREGRVHFGNAIC